MLCPRRRVLRCEPLSGACSAVADEAAPAACEGISDVALHGGAPPILLDRPGGGKLMLGVAHSQLNLSAAAPHAPLVVTWAYRHYFFALDPQPPFELRAVSPSFLFPSHYGNDIDLIQFCSSLDRQRQPAGGGADRLTLGYGVGDCEAMELTLPLSDVLLPAEPAVGL